ncbi:hypothetical protein Tco_1229531 [Tanacetum coccineum]
MELPSRFFSALWGVNLVGIFKLCSVIDSGITVCGLVPMAKDSRFIFAMSANTVPAYRIRQRPPRSILFAPGSCGGVVDGDQFPPIDGEFLESPWAVDGTRVSLRSCYKADAPLKCTCGDVVTAAFISMVSGSTTALSQLMWCALVVVLGSLKPSVAVSPLGFFVSGCIVVPPPDPLDAVAVVRTDLLWSLDCLPGLFLVLRSACRSSLALFNLASSTGSGTLLPLSICLSGICHSHTLQKPSMLCVGSLAELFASSLSEVSSEDELTLLRRLRRLSSESVLGDLKLGERLCPNACWGSSRAPAFMVAVRRLLFSLSVKFCM